MRIRLRNVAGQPFAAPDNAISRTIGYQFTIDGNDVIVEDQDPALLRGPRDALRSGDFLPFRRASYQEIADTYIDFLDTKIEAEEKPPPRPLPIFEKYGFSEFLRQQQIHFHFEQRANLRRHCIEQLFPFIKERLNPRWVVPIGMDCTYHQTLLSFAKIGMLLQKYGPEDAQRRVIERRALSSVFPFAADYLSYVYPLVMMQPFLFALPMSRVGSALLFVRDGAWEFPWVANVGLFSAIADDTDPLAESRPEARAGLGEIGHNGARALCQLAVEGVNRVSAYLNDPRNFETSEGEFDFEKSVKVQTAIRLLFADALDINQTNSSYLKHRIAFSFLDKMANLLRHTAQGSSREDEIFCSLLSEAQRDRSIGTLRHVFRPNGARITTQITAFSRNTFDLIHDKVSDSIGNNEENRILSHIRSLRNTNHGTFLTRAQFETLFYGSDGAVPYEIKNVPFVLMWTLVADPPRFLGPAE